MEMVLVDNNIMLICCILIPIYSANVYTAYVFVYRMLTCTIVDHMSHIRICERLKYVYTYIRILTLLYVCVYCMCVCGGIIHAYTYIYRLQPLHAQTDIQARTKYIVGVNLFLMSLYAYTHIRIHILILKQSS